MGLPLGLYTHHYGKGCGRQGGVGGGGRGKQCQYRGVNQVSRHNPVDFLAPKGALEIQMFVCQSVCQSVHQCHYAIKLFKGLLKGS